MKTKLLFLFAIILSVGADGSSFIMAQEPIDLEVVWQKEVFPKEIKFANFSADGQWIYAAIGNTIEKISAETGEFLSVFNTEGLSSGIYEMDISPLGKLIVTLDAGAIMLWDTQLEKAIKYKTFKETNSGGAIAVALSLDEKYLALDVTRRDSITQEMNSYFVFYDIINDKEIKRIPTGQDCRKIKFSHDGKYFATGGFYEDKWEGKFYDQVILWSTETWSPVDTIETLEGSGDGYRVIKFSKDDIYLNLVRILPNDSRIYNMETKQVIFNSDINKQCYNIDFLPDNTHFLVSYWSQSQGDSLELHNINGFIKSYNISSSNLISFGSINDYKIFCGGSKYYPISMLKNKITEVEPRSIFIKNIDVSIIDKQIIIETKNTNYPKLSIEIYDIQGTIIYSELLEHYSPSSKYSLDIKLSTGTYICNVKTDDKIYSQKIVVVK